MPTQLHSQARMMQYIAIVTSLVSFFRSLGGIVALTVMASVVNNKLISALGGGISLSSSFTSLNSIQNLPPAVQQQVQNAFANAVKWAYIAMIPFVGLAAVGVLFLRDVKVERTQSEVVEHEHEKIKEDAELGQIPSGNEENAARPLEHKPRIRVYGPASAIIWCCQAIGDKMGWRK
jgi:hypothetical protein